MTDGTNTCASFTRTIQLLGEPGWERLNQSHVAVLGLGGVGGFVVENLVRSGVGHLTIVDFDDVSQTNLNRQITALHSTIGKSKAETFAQRLLDINPDVNVHLIKRFIDRDSLPELLAPDYDYIVDAIDSFSPKLELLKLCLQRQLPIVSSMGAASRLDPTQIRLGNLAETTVCPLARRMRKFLRRIGVNPADLPVVYSVESPIPGIPPDDAEDPGNHPQGRPRTVNGSISFIPAIFGCYLAAFVINAICNNQKLPNFYGK